MLRHQIRRPIGNQRNGAYEKSGPARAEPINPGRRDVNSDFELTSPSRSLANDWGTTPTKPKWSTRRSVRKASTPIPSYIPWWSRSQTRTHGGSSGARGKSAANSDGDVFFHYGPAMGSNAEPPNTRLALLKFESNDDGTISSLVPEHVLEKVPSFAQQLEESRRNISGPYTRLTVEADMSPVETDVMYQAIEYLTNSFLTPVGTENKEKDSDRLDELLKLWKLAIRLGTTSLRDAVKEHLCDPKWDIEIYRSFALRTYKQENGEDSVHHPTSEIGAVIYSYLSNNIDSIVADGHLPKMLEGGEEIQKQMHEILEGRFRELRRQEEVRSRANSPPAGTIFSLADARDHPELFHHSSDDDYGLIRPGWCSTW